MIQLKHTETKLMIELSIWRNEQGVAVLARSRPFAVRQSFDVWLPDDLNEWDVWNADEEAVRDLTKSGYKMTATKEGKKATTSN